MKFEFKVYFQRQPLDSFKTFVWKKKGQLLMRLSGSNTDFRPPNDIYMEPVYIPFFAWKKDGERLFIDIHWFWQETCRTIILMAHAPFFWTGTTDKIELQDIEEN